LRHGPLVEGRVWQREEVSRIGPCSPPSPPASYLPEVRARCDAHAGLLEKLKGEVEGSAGQAKPSILFRKPSTTIEIFGVFGGFFL
jgi:hypothetical protein